MVQKNLCYVDMATDIELKEFLEEINLMKFIG